MKSKKNLLNGTSVLLITLLMFSSVVVTVHANISQIYPEMSNMNRSIYAMENSREDIVWDNSMDYDEMHLAIVDIYHGVDIGVADDFMFAEDTAVLEVHWVGGYKDNYYQTGNFDWVIGFFYDQGDGNEPGELIVGYNYQQSECNPVELEDTGNEIYYEFTAILPDILYFQADTKYWIEIFAVGEAPPFSGWAYHENPILLHQAVIGSDSQGIPYWTDIDFSLGFPADMCFQLIEAPFPDLDCEGSLSWTDVEPGTMVTGSFEIENSGDPGTLLDWEITEYPDWGTWMFDPDEGEDLTPEAGAITVDVTVQAPDDQEKIFTGHVTITNTEDSGDFCVIDVSLATPVNQQEDTYPLLQMILERFPNAFPMLRYLLGQ